MHAHIRCIRFTQNRTPLFALIMGANDYADDAITDLDNPLTMPPSSAMCL